MEKVVFEQKSDFELQVCNLQRNDYVYVQIENFDIQIKRTDEGLVIDVFDMDDPLREESIATTYAFDTDTRSYSED